MALFALKQNYYSVLDNQPEFEKKPTRLYYVVNKLTYKNKNISVAIPLRANINKKFQKNSDEYLATAPTAHTQSGSVAGWHITKMIPVNSEAIIKTKTSSPDLTVAELTVGVYKQDFINKVKAMLLRFENGEQVFGAIDFDSALTELDKLTQK